MSSLQVFVSGCSVSVFWRRSGAQTVHSEPSTDGIQKRTVFEQVGPSPPNPCVMPRLAVDFYPSYEHEIITSRPVPDTQRSVRAEWIPSDNDAKCYNDHSSGGQRECSWFPHGCFHGTSDRSPPSLWTTVMTVAPGKLASRASLVLVTQSVQRHASSSRRVVLTVYDPTELGTLLNRVRIARFY